MNCDDVKDKLALHAEGSLDAADAAAVDAHAAECPQCREKLEELREVVDALRGAELPDPGDLFHKKFRETTMRRVRQVPVMRRARAVLMASAMLIMLITGVAVFRYQSGTQTGINPGPDSGKTKIVSDREKEPYEGAEQDAEDYAEEQEAVAVLLSEPAMYRAPVDVEDTSAVTASEESDEEDETLFFEDLDEIDTQVMEEYDTDTVDSNPPGEYVIPEMIEQMTDDEAAQILEALGQTDTPDQDPQLQSALRRDVS